MTQTNTRIENTRPRHLAIDRDSPSTLALRWFFTLRWQLLALFLSDLGRSMIYRKYDAFTTDNGYQTSPRGKNPISRSVDRVVRRRDTHVALRQRLDLVVSELVESTLARRGQAGVRLVSGPVGLGRDVRSTWDRLGRLGTGPETWLEVAGVDLDASNTVLAEASRQALAASVPLETYRADLLDSRAVTRAVGGSVDVFNCIGLTTWLDEQGVGSLLGAIGETLAPRGCLVIDHWRQHSGSKYVDALQMPARYLTDGEFEAGLIEAGFEIEQKRATANGVVVVYRAVLSK